MTSFHFASGSYELLDYCDSLWELFIDNQVQSAGEMASGVEEYLRYVQETGLKQKNDTGKLHVQLIYLDSVENAVAFCVTSLTAEKIGEIEVLYVMDNYQGNKLGSKLVENALLWLKEEQAVEQRLVVATGNERVFDFYANYGFYPGYTTLFRAE